MNDIANGRAERKSQAPQIPWETLEQIVDGRQGRVYAPCPLCSAGRRTANSRSSKVLAVTRIDADHINFYCNHCGVNGYAHPATGTSRQLDHTELQRRREQAARFAAHERKRRTQSAVSLWEEAGAFAGSLAESYLRETRKIGDWLDVLPFLDRVFRFHPGCPFGNERLPCLLALVRDIKSNAPLAIHRTALTKDGHKIDRMSLGPVGGGAIKISTVFEIHRGLMIGEGIETVLSASKYFQFKPVWSLIDAGNLSKFPAPLGGAVKCVTIAIDNDEAGIEAAEQCTQRLLEAGVEVVTAKPNRVNDFNDLIVGDSAA